MEYYSSCINTWYGKLPIVAENRNWESEKYGANEKKICSLCFLDVPEIEEHLTLKCLAYENRMHYFMVLLQGCTNFQELLTRMEPSQLKSMSKCWRNHSKSSSCVFILTTFQLETFARMWLYTHLLYSPMRKG